MNLKLIESLQKRLSAFEIIDISSAYCIHKVV